MAASKEPVGEVTSNRPGYREIAVALRARIESSEFAPGMSIPSETALIAEFSVARGTVRQALALLEEQGMVETAHGRGRFVCGEGGSQVAEAKHWRIAAELRARIESGELLPGAFMPSEAEVRAEFGVSRTTARNAFAALEEAGLIRTEWGRGRFVQE
jgi:DNA-binding GntR family transcriptional regulator